MEQYTVTGMSCAACSARVEKAVSGVPGVSSCAVNLLTHSMGVEGTASPQEIIRAVEEAGYSLWWYTGSPLQRLLWLWSAGSRRLGFSSRSLRALERRLSSCAARA